MKVKVLFKILSKILDFSIHMSEADHSIDQLTANFNLIKSKDFSDLIGSQIMLTKKSSTYLVDSLKN